MRSLAELGRDYNGLIVAIENELCAVEGLEGLQAQARKGTDTDKETHARQARQAKEISVINSYAMSAGPLGPVSVLQ